MALCDFTQDAVKGHQFDIGANEALVRELVQPNVIDFSELVFQDVPMTPWSNGLVDINYLMNNLEYGQELNIKFENPVDLLGLVKVADLEAYTPIDNCHERITLQCPVECLTSTPSFTNCQFKFSKSLTIGVQRCVTTERFYSIERFAKQWKHAVKAYEMMKNLLFWNQAVCNAVNAPGNVLNNAFAKNFGSDNYLVVGNDVQTTRRNIIGGINQVVEYYMNTFGRTPLIYTSSKGLQAIRENLIVLQQSLPGATMGAGQYATPMATLLTGMDDSKNGFTVYTQASQFFHNVPVNVLKDTAMVSGGLATQAGATAYADWLNPFNKRDNDSRFYVFFTLPEANIQTDLMLVDHIQKAQYCVDPAKDGVESYIRNYLLGFETIVPEFQFIIEGVTDVAPALDYNICMDACKVGEPIVHGPAPKVKPPVVKPVVPKPAENH